MKKHVTYLEYRVPPLFLRDLERRGWEMLEAVSTEGMDMISRVIHALSKRCTCDLVVKTDLYCSICHGKA